MMDDGRRFDWIEGTVEPRQILETGLFLTVKSRLKSSSLRSCADCSSPSGEYHILTLVDWHNLLIPIFRNYHHEESEQGSHSTEENVLTVGDLMSLFVDEVEDRETVYRQDLPEGLPGDQEALGPNQGQEL